MHVNGNASVSPTLSSSTLTTNGITCGPISCTGSGTKQTTPSTASVYIGLGSTTAGGIEICARASQYIDFTSAGTDFQRKDVIF